MSTKTEVRHYTDAEIRMDEANPGKMTGYAAKFNSDSVEMFFFKEQIAPGAFTRTLKENKDVVALFGHDDKSVLGRTTNGSLLLREDDQGLYTEIDLPDTNLGRDLRFSLKRQDIKSMSFGFRVPQGGDDWTLRDGKDFRTIKDLDLIEVSVVTFPAYPATSAYVRSCRSPEEIYQERSKPKESSGNFTAKAKMRLAWYEKIL